MSDQGKANYEAYRKLAGRPGVSAAPLPEYEQLPMELAYAFDAGADAVEQWLAEAPVDEDAPGNEPAKVIVVTEVPAGERGPVERRYRADEGDDHTDYGRLRIKRDGRKVAGYNADAWLSWREHGAEVDDETATALAATRYALDIAMTALNQVSRLTAVESAERKVAASAIGELFDLGFE